MRLATSLLSEQKETAALGNSERVFLGVPCSDPDFVFRLLLDLVLFVEFGELFALGTVRITRFFGHYWLLHLRLKGR